MNLYKNLSVVYHQMYQQLFDYDDEFMFYNNTLNKFNCTKVIEYGCGTGNLGKRFVKNGIHYLGVDLSQEMLDIALKNEEVTSSNFIQGDLKTFHSETIYDAALITGRTISYLSTNKEVLQSFASIGSNLKKGGVFIFDAIDAAKIFQNFDESDQEVIVNQYKRISCSRPNLETGWTWDWSAEYFEKVNNEYVSVGKDYALVRSFTKDEIAFFLEISGFELLEVVSKETYAWKDDYFVARKL